MAFWKIEIKKLPPTVIGKSNRVNFNERIV
jgi:hypothetical protein